ALAGNLVLALVLVGVWWHSSHQKKPEMTMQPAANEAADASPSGRENTETAPHEAALVPVQLSPEPLQSIGVRMGRVERKTVGDEIRVTGNVAVDETNLPTCRLVTAATSRKSLPTRPTNTCARANLFSPSTVLISRPLNASILSQNRISS